MSHPKSLIGSIRALLEADYPPDMYEYVIEKALPGTRFYPDIAVLEAGRVICAVEVGYTRPEKLAAYRNVLHIPDVRWYDKAGNLHTAQDVRQVRAVVEVRVHPESEFYLYQVEDQVDCGECSDEWYEEWKEETASATPEDEEQPATEEEFFEFLTEEAPAAVTTIVITDYSRAFFPSFCDKCGRFWLADDEEAVLLYEDLAEAVRSRSLRDFGRQHGQRIPVSWEHAWTEARKRISWEEPVLYFDGLALQGTNDKAAVNAAVQVRTHANVVEFSKGAGL